MPANRHQRVEPACDIIRARIPTAPEIALVLGSGLGSLADTLADPIRIPAHELPHYPISTAPGHQGQLVFGALEGRQVVFVQGRVHLYEGISIHDVVFPIRLLHALGARRLLVTNAAGGINPAFSEGDLMLITDHINMAFTSPLGAANLPEGWPLSPMYDPGWLQQAAETAHAEGIPLQQGVYLWTPGPSYETKAEIRAFRRLGGDAVGMSTVPEVLMARALGMPVLGLSAITNLAAGMHDTPLRHDDVLAAGRRLRDTAERLLRALVRTSPTGSA